MQGSIQTPRFRTEKGCTNFPEQTQTLSKNQHGLLIQGMYTRVFSKLDTDFSNHRDARRFSTGVGLVVLSRLRTRSDNRVEWGRNPSHGSPWPFYSHVLGLTLFTHGTACIPPTRITLVRPPLPKLRINIKCTCSFWNNIKILFPGLSPLGLALRLNT
jgi:hypothetical protein